MRSEGMTWQVERLFHLLMFVVSILDDNRVKNGEKAIEYGNLKEYVWRSLIALDLSDPQKDCARFEYTEVNGKPSVHRPKSV